MPNDRIDSAIAGAFAKWQVASPFTFSKITSGTPDIDLSFGNITASDDAHAVARGQTIIFNDKRTWLDLADEVRAKNITTSVGLGVTVISGPFAPFVAMATLMVRAIWDGVDGLDINRPDVLSIAVHEIGHALGLAHNAADALVMQSKADYLKMVNVNEAPISQVDIDALKAAYAHLYSDYYARHGVTGWFKRGDGFVQVSAGLDNTVWAVDNKGQAREFSAADESGRGDH